MNAVLEDTNDNSIIVSSRAQGSVFKISRSTGQLKWILGAHENWGTNWQPYLLTPVGTPFEWNFGQHAPEVTPHGTLALYDNGNNRANPFDPIVADDKNYSRAVEFSINETNMEVSQVWDSSKATNVDRLFTPIVGDANWLPRRGNFLVTYGYATYVNGAHPSPYAPKATMVRIREYTHDPVPQVVFDVSFFDHSNTDSGYVGCFCYRSIRIPDLYTHPAQEVVDLTLRLKNGKPILEFSGDETHSYTIEASDDLSAWQTLGPASADDSYGDFSFQGLPTTGFTNRYYRVVTE